MSDSNLNDGIPLLEQGNKQSESSSSDSQPPPGDDSSSSPSDSNSQQSPPPSDSGGSSDSPPSDSGGSSDSPPSDSGGSSDSGSSNSPPPSDSGSDSSQNSSPPPEGGGDSQPPPDSSNNSPPNDRSSSSKDSPPKSDNSPSPSNSPKDSNGPPKWQDSPPTPRNGNDETPAVPSPPGSRSSQRHPELTPSSTRSESSSSSHSSRSNDSSTSGTIAGVTVAGVVIIALVALVFVVSRKKKRRVQAYPDHYGPPPNFSGNSDGFYYGHHSQQHTIGISGQSQEFYGAKPPPPPPAYSTYGSYRGGPDSGVIGGGMSSFSYEELMGITNGFSRQNVIGEGGFGSVYKGFLSDGRAVAVKQLKAGSGQGEREFRAEVEIISRVHHRHLVSLVGYCIADSQRLLVYEFVSNKTLEHHLHAEGLPVMEWSKRMSIAVGAARGLAYLHEDCHPKIIHRDIKSANILVDDVFEAQVADFGLAKLSNDMSTHVSTRVMGTFGYMAPEYANSGKLTDRSDVFSFGVVLLELVTGRKPVDLDEDESLVEWARPICARAVETRDFSEIADPRLQRRYVESEMLRMIETAAACVRHSAQKRPRMVQVLRALDTDGDMPDISNGVKVGQSTIYQVGQYNSEMEKFRMMAFGSGESSEYQMYSGNQSKEVLPRPPMGSEFSSGDSETVAINPRTKAKF